MKQLGLGKNSTYLSRKICSHIFQGVSSSRNSVSALRWAVSEPVTLVLAGLLRVGQVDMQLLYSVHAHIFYLLRYSNEKTIHQYSL